MILDILLDRLKMNSLISEHFECSISGKLRPLIIKPKDSISNSLDFSELNVKFVWATLEDEGKHIKKQLIKIDQTLREGSTSKKNLFMTPDKLIEKLTTILNSIFPSPPEYEKTTL